MLYRYSIEHCSTLYSIMLPNIQAWFNPTPTMNKHRLYFRKLAQALALSTAIFPSLKWAFS